MGSCLKTTKETKPKGGSSDEPPFLLITVICKLVFLR